MAERGAGEPGFVLGGCEGAFVRGGSMVRAGEEGEGAER